MKKEIEVGTMLGRGSRPNPRVQWAFRIALLVLGATLVPACGGGGSGTDLPAYSPPPPIVLMDDTFANLDQWTLLSPSASVDSSVGNPPPSMLVNANGGSAAIVRTKATFSTAVGLTVLVDAFTGSSNGGVTIIDAANPGTLDTYASFTATTAFLSIKGTTKMVSFPSDGKFHLWEFVITSGGAGWGRDGATLFMAPYSAPNVYIEIFDQNPGTGTWVDGAIVKIP